MASTADKFIPPITLVRVEGNSLALQFLDLWEHREPLFFFVWRDLKVRYKQTVLGALWAILQPLATMLVFSIFFGHLGKVPSDGIPYPIFVYCALVPWQMFAFAITEASNSLVQNQYLLTKIYFPRLIIPLAPVFTALVDFAFAFAMLIALMIYYGMALRPIVILLPLFVAFTSIASFAVGVWLSALTAEYRDVRHMLPFIVQFWLFVTPIAYPGSLVPAKWRVLYSLNPMACVVEGFRWILLGAAAPSWTSLAASTAAVLLLLCSGIMYFRRLESTFADVI